MSKPRVSEIDFWKERIRDAKREQDSVYICNDRLWKEILEGHSKIIKRIIKDSAKVLDAGCGYGRMSELFNPKNYTGVDFSPDFIEIAKKKYPNNKFEVQDLTKLPYKDQEFDWSFCVSIKNMIETYDSPLKWLEMEQELKRVSKSILILEYTDKDGYTIL